MLVKNAYKDDPLFADTKIVYSVYNDDFEKPLDKNYVEKLKQMGGFEGADLKKLKDPTFVNITKTAIDLSDAVIKASETINPDIEKYIKNINKPTLTSFWQTKAEYVEAYYALYNEVLVEQDVLID